MKARKTKKNKKPFISIVIPFLDEEGTLQKLYNSVKRNLQKGGFPHEIIFIDDGSTDNGAAVVEKLYKRDMKHVVSITFRRNFGKAAALACGFEYARGDIIITMDADLQDDPNEISRLIAKINEGYDLVSGWKYKRYDPITKTIPSKIFNRAVSFVSGVKIHDFNCGLKAYRTEVVKELDVYGSFHRFIPAMAHWRGFRVTEIKVKHHPRTVGKSKYGVRRYIPGFMDLLTLWYLWKFGQKPIKLFGVTGIVFFLFGFINWIYIYLPKALWLVSKALFNLGMGGDPGDVVTIGQRLPMIMISLLFILVGIQLFSTGLVAEYIVYSASVRRDYTIRKELGLWHQKK